VIRAVHARAVLLALAAACCNGSGASAPPSDGGDATSALEAAIATAPDGAVSIAGSGTYVVRSVAVRRAGATIECVGSPPAVIQLAALTAGDGAPVFDVRANDFTIRKCIIDGNRSAQPAGGFNDSFDGRAFRSGVRMDGRYQGLTIEQATFRNVYGAAIATRNVSSIVVRSSTFRDNNFEAVFADNSYSLGDPRHFLGGFTFVGNTVANAGSRDSTVNANGILVHQMTDLVITDNAWSAYERAAMKLENCRSGTVANNRIQAGSIPNFAAISLQNGAHDLTIRDNDIRDAGTGIDTSLVDSGQYPPDDIVDLSILANTIRSIRRGQLANGIRVLGYGAITSDVTIDGNSIKDVPGQGIDVRQFRIYHPSPVLSRITIRDNVLTSAGSCAGFFSDSPVEPQAVTSSGNRCD
jgi:hypothetical protein